MPTYQSMLLVAADSGTPDVGGQWRYNAQGTPGFKLGKPVVFHANDYGCVGDGVTDDTAALQALFNAASVAPGSTLLQGLGGGVVVFPNNAVYRCNGRLSFNYRQYLIVRGPAKIHFTGSGSAPFIELLSCAEWTFEDIHFTYENPAFTGHIVQTGHGTPASDTAGLTFDRCFFYGTDDATGNHGAASCLSLKNCIDIRVHDCEFTAAKRGIDGADPTLGFANTVLIDGCTFHKLGNGLPTLTAGVGNANGCAAIWNPGEAWTIINNTFESLQSSSGGFVSMNAIYQDSTFFSWSPFIAGNWMGDGGGGGAWITLTSLGASITGNLISGSYPDNVILLRGCNGTNIAGNRLSGGIAFAANTMMPPQICTGCVIAGNSIQTTVPYANVGNVNRLWRFANDDWAAGEFLSTPYTVGDATYSASYTRVILSTTKTYDPGTVAVGAGAQSADIPWTGCHIGAVFAFGVTPAPPVGVIVDAKIQADSQVRVQVFNFSGAPYTPGVLSFKFHMWE